MQPADTGTPALPEAGPRRVDSWREARRALRKQLDPGKRAISQSKYEQEFEELSN